MRAGGIVVATPATLASAAILAAICRYGLFSAQNEMISEVLCWLMLSFGCCIVQGGLTVSMRQAVKSSYGHRPLWLAAFGIALVNIFEEQHGILELMPLLGAALLAAKSNPDVKFGGTLLSTLCAHSPQLLFPTFISVLATIVLSREDPYYAISSGIVVFPLIAVCFFSIRGSSSAGPLPFDDIHELMGRLSLRVSMMLTIFIFGHILIAGPFIYQTIPVLGLALAKAGFWYFVARTIHYASWSFAPYVQAFGILATRNPFLQTSDSQAVLYVISSLAVLVQVVLMVPARTKAKLAISAFALLPLWSYTTNMAAIKAQQLSARSSFVSTRQHPISALVETSERQFEDLIRRQSSNFTSAYNNYRSKYHADPPPGFEEWYEYAIAQNSSIIDDFDTIHKSISPFLTLSGKEFVQMIDSAFAVEGSELWLCRYSGAKRQTTCQHPTRTNDRHITLSFDRLLHGIGSKLNDIKFLVNHLDEPRVLMPPFQGEGDKAAMQRQLRMVHLSHQPTYDAITQFCSAQHLSEPVQSGEKEQTYELPFVQNFSSSIDLCLHDEYRKQHGLLMRPVSMRLMQGWAPILSTGTLSTMGDILFPSPAYSEDEFQYDSLHDPEWDQKKGSLYWAGSTTGGFASSNDWMNYHRQRFVALGQGLEPRRYSYLVERYGQVAQEKSSFLNARLFEVAFTRILHCETIFCRSQRFYFRTKSWADRNKAFQFKLAFDTDGNGISGRFHQLLASNSAPLKQTLLREWHDDRLIPWVHYVPVSQGLAELPEIVSHLTLHEHGQIMAKKIADNGKAWSRKALREVDSSIYLYRLMLELARLQDPERKPL